MTEPVKKPKSVFETLAEGNQPSVENTSAAALVAPATVPVDGNVLGQLLNYLILKEGREAQAAEQALAREKVRQQQRNRNAKDQDSKALLKQARCKHLKGGKRGPKTQNKDYAVYQHVFVNFSTYIRCRICGMKWYPQDTVEYLMRNGRKISNHTKIGWREAIAMTDASTDTISKSEAIPNANPTGTAQYTDASGQSTTPRVVDLEGNLVSDVEV